MTEDLLIEPIATAAKPAVSCSPATRRKILHAGVGSWFMFSIGALGLTPAYPLIAHDLNLSPDLFASLLAIAMLVSSLLQLPSGTLVDRVGYRGMVVAGVVLGALAPALWGTAADGGGFALAQVALGMSLVALQAGCLTAIARAFSAGGRAAAMSFVWTGSSVGSVLSQLLYGVASERVGWRLVSLGVACLQLTIMPLVLRMPSRDARQRGAPLRQQLRESAGFVRGRLPLLICSIAALLSAAGLGCALLAPFVLHAEGYDSGAIAWFLLCFVGGGIVAAPIIGLLADRRGARAPLLIPLAASALAASVVAFVGPRPLVFGAMLVVVGAILNGGLPLLQSMTAGVAAAGTGIGVGVALATVRLTQSLGGAAGSVLIGAIYVRFGSAVAELTLAGLLACAFVLGHIATSARRPFKG